jgi:hypothetical protein
MGFVAKEAAAAQQLLSFSRQLMNNNPSSRIALSVYTRKPLQPLDVQ